MNDSQHKVPPSEPSLVISHSETTDQMATYLKGAWFSTERFKFLPSTKRTRHSIASALTSVMGIRAVEECVDTSTDSSQSRFHPIIVQLCAAVEMGETAQDIKRTAQTARHELNRSLISGTNVLVVYLGPLDGLLPKQTFIEDLKSIDRYFDLVVLVTDSDARGRRYLWQDIELVLCRFIDCVLKSASLREFLFDVAVNTNPKNRFITFGLARVNVSIETILSYVYSYLSSALFETLFPTDEKSEIPAFPVTDPEYLSSKYRSSGAIGPVVSSLVPTERQLAYDYRLARADELACQAKNALMARRIALTIKPRSRLSRVFSRVRKYFFRKQSNERPPQRPKTERITAKRAKVFEELLRLKQIELELQPSTGTQHEKPSFPLDISLANLPSRKHEMLAELSEVRKIAWDLTQEISLDDLLSGRITAKDLTKKIDALWLEHLVPEKIAEFLASDEFARVLYDVGGRISPLLPSYGGKEGKLVLSPPDSAGTTQVKGFQTAVGIPDEYILVVAGECSDLSLLDTQGALENG